MENIRMIDIEKIHQHPDNPRKDVGDVTELAESIKQQGIMQNLTVVPFVSKFNKNFNGEGMFTVIIGHRRLAAAKLAGLKQVPCAVVEMSEKEQIAVMLSENMQRVDLTVVEQAQGIQMLFDLGESVSEISEKTGFSESTVRKRMKVATLPFDQLKQAEERGGTLEEYVKCCEIENEKERKRCLEAAGTRDFDWKYKSAIKDQNLKKNTPLIKKEIKKLAKQISDSDRWSSKYDSHSSIEIANWKPGDKLIKGYSEKKEYFWSISYGTLYISTKAKNEKAEPVKKSEKEIEANRRRKKLKEMFETAHSLREQFVLNFSVPNKYEKVIIKHLVKFTAESIVRYYSGDTDFIKRAIGDEGTKYYPDDEKLKKFIDEDPAAILVLAYYQSGDNKQRVCFGSSWNEQFPPYRKNEDLESIYEFLIELGYQISTEEQQLLNGTHELYAKDGEDNE